MAFEYQGFATLGVNLNRQKYGPLDISNVFTSENDLKYYLTKGAHTEGVSKYWYESADKKVVPYPYEGQVLATVINGDVKVYVLKLDAEGAFEAKAIEPEVDGKTIKLTNGKLELAGLDKVETGKTYVPSLVNGVLTWSEPDTSTAEGQQQAIDGLTASVAGLAEVINGKAGSGEEGSEDYIAPVVGLVDKVAALEAIDNATQAELDAYKEVVTAAIAAGVKEAKDYADAQDADTVYDDKDLQDRVKALEDKPFDTYATKSEVEAVDGKLADYVKTTDLETYQEEVEETFAGVYTKDEADEKFAVKGEDSYNDEEVRGLISDNAEAIEAINTALSTKAAQSDLETLKGRVDTFFAGTGVENVIDTLEDLIKYINEHDDVEVSGILSSIEAIEGKLEGVESTVVTYVTAAIDALKIGDYAKAADLTDLAGRVSTLETASATHATKTEVEEVAGDLADYVEANDAALAGVKATAEAAAVKTDVETALAGKVDNETLNNYYTSEEIEAKGYAVASEVEATYATKSEVTEAVEGIENDLLAYAKTADVNAELAKKIETGSISHSTEDLAEGVTVEGTKLNIVVDAYTKAETLAQIEEILDQINDNSESANSVNTKLENHIKAYTEKVGQIDAKDAAQDTAISAAQTQADKGVADAAKVAADLATANLAIADNTREIGVVKDSISSVNTTLSGKITALEGKDTAIEGNITALQTTVSGHTTTITEQGVAIAALQDEDTRLAALIQGNTDKFAGYYTKGEVDTKVQEAIDAIPAVDFTGYATETYVTDAIAIVNEEVGKKANAADVYTITAADAKFQTADQVKAIVDKVVADVSDTDTIEGLVTLVNYVHDNAGDIAKLVSDVEANRADIEGNAEAIAKNAGDIVAINEALAAIVQPKASEEISVGTDGTLGIVGMSTDKLVQGTDTLVLNGGDAGVKAE